MGVALDEGDPLRQSCFGYMPVRGRVALRRSRGWLTGRPFPQGRGPSRSPNTRGRSRFEDTHRTNCLDHEVEKFTVLAGNAPILVSFPVHLLQQPFQLHGVALHRPWIHHLPRRARSGETCVATVIRTPPVALRNPRRFNVSPFFMWLPSSESQSISIMSFPFR